MWSCQQIQVLDFQPASSSLWAIGRELLSCSAFVLRRPLHDCCHQQVNILGHLKSLACQQRPQDLSLGRTTLAVHRSDYSSGKASAYSGARDYLMELYCGRRKGSMKASVKLEDCHSLLGLSKTQASQVAAAPLTAPYPKPASWASLAVSSESRDTQGKFV